MLIGRTSKLEQSKKYSSTNPTTLVVVLHRLALVTRITSWGEAHKDRKQRGGRGHGVHPPTPAPTWSTLLRCSTNWRRATSRTIGCGSAAPSASSGVGSDQDQRWQARKLIKEIIKILTIMHVRQACKAWNNFSMLAYACMIRRKSNLLK